MITQDLIIRTRAASSELVIVGDRAYNACIAITLECHMASLTIRNFDDALKSSLRLQAARHGHSMEQEVREILRRAVQPAATNTDFAQRIRKRFAGLSVEELPIPKRRAARIPATPKA